MIELIQAGIFDSSHIFIPEGDTPERETNFYEIELYLSGDGKTYIDSESYPHSKGNLIFVKPGQLRHSRNKFICLYVRLDIGRETAKLLRNIPPVTRVTNFTVYERCFTDIMRLYESENDNQELLIQSKLYELLDMILKDSVMSSRAQNSGCKIAPETIQKAIDFMNEHYSERLTLKDIAQSVSFSPIYFHNAFTAYVGKTPHAFLSEKRLETAKMYLLTSDYTLDEIADKCGFSSHSYFDYHFKKAYGVTPSQFRKRKYTL